MRRGLGPLEGADAGAIRGDGDDRQVRIDQRLQVRPFAADENADHAAHSTPSIAALDPADHEVVARDVGGRDHGAVADPDVEDAAQLVLGDAVRGEPAEHLGPLPGRRVDDGAEAVRQHPREVARDAAAGDVGEPAHVGAGTQRANVVEVEARRRQQQIGIERLVADDAPDEREPVRVDPGRRRSRSRRRRPRCVSRRRHGRGRRRRRPCRRSRSRPRGRCRAAPPSRRRGSRSRRRGRRRRRPRSARRPARRRSCWRRRSRGRRAARRRS